MSEVNVKVAVRIRPLLPKEKLGGEAACVKVNAQNKQVIVGKDRGFTFDHVFGSKSTQVGIYDACVHPLVESIFSGYNATVFAYGQTGSGKTYTMGGGNITPVTEEEIGIIPRAISHMYHLMQNNSEVTYSVSVSYIEIYKEELRDLLDLNTPGKDLHLRENDKGHTVIVGAREVQCESMDEMMSLVEVGSAARQTGATLMNDYSSRSHSIFTILIGQTWTEGEPMSGRSEKHIEFAEDSETPTPDMKHHMSGKFHFVDLAGSERAHRTGNVGDRFKESIHINTGLLGLGNVISALADPRKRASHIPYRDSKITRLLKDSLGGNAETLMICCISPAASSFDESLNALKYANRAKNIKNKPVVNRDIQSIRFEEMQTEIRALREELARQRSSAMSNHGNQGRDTSDDGSHVKSLEQQIVRLEAECNHHRTVTNEAYEQLVTIHERDILTQSLDHRLKDWLDLIEEFRNKVPMTPCKEIVETETVTDLRQQIHKYKADLKSDEKIFSEKAREIEHLVRRATKLDEEVERGREALVECEERCKQREQQLLDQQMTIETLHNNMKEKLVCVEDSGDHDLILTASAPLLTKARPTSVPIHIHGTRELLSGRSRAPPRNIHTSPAVYSLERVMQGFRAHTQMLVSRLEDHDEVLHRSFGEEPEEEVKMETEIAQEDETTGVFVRKGTYRVKKGRKLSDEGDKENKVAKETKAETAPADENPDLKKQIKQAQLKILSSNQKMRELAVNIRMKEQLIKELVKTGKKAEVMNKQYADKVKVLQKEKSVVQAEMNEMQRAVGHLDTQYATQPQLRDSLSLEYKEKLEVTKAKFSSLNKKQKDTEKAAGITAQNSSKIHSLEESVDRMRRQSDVLQKKLRDEADRKLKLEREMQKDQHKIKDLETKNEKQQKILKRKNEEIAAAQRRLRHTSLPPLHTDEERLDEQKRWLDGEMDKVVKQKRQMEAIESELARREEILAKKEMMLAEKSEIEMRKMRSSQMINKDLLSVSTKLDSVEQKLEAKSKELVSASGENHSQTKEEVIKLNEVVEKLKRQREGLDEKLREGRVLSELEERRLIEVEEAIETLDAAIEYKNDAIHQRQVELRRSQTLNQTDEMVKTRLNCLSATETRQLLTRYWEKVVAMREGERRATLKHSEMEMKIDEQERLIHDLEAALQTSTVEADRRITSQQKECEQRLQVLMGQVGDGGQDALNARLHKLEKDVYFYRKTSRDLKQKIRDLVSTGTIPHPDDLDVHASQQSVPDLKGQGHDAKGQGQQSHRHSQRTPRPPSEPVKVSTKDVRMLSEEDVARRRHGSNLSVHLHDSLETGENG